VHFLKGHGTGNDFVLLPDPDGRLDLPADLVRRLCDRRRGIGGDGVLRVVRTTAAGDAPAGEAEWFMDHRNADGSLAEMCGNGARVFGRYLVDAGLAPPGRLPFATRGGLRWVEVPEDGDVVVDMGSPAFDLEGPVKVFVADRTYVGDAVSMGNPHVVCVVGDLAEVGDLRLPPEVDEVRFPAGVNVEFYRPVGPDHLAMRVHERGVGETASCGTGACAVAVADARARSARYEADVRVDVPGGRLRVRWTRSTVLLSGPAALVAAGEVRVAELG
jgi:diaminopimelate epimerase